MVGLRFLNGKRKDGNQASSAGLNVGRGVFDELGFGV